ncbi:Unknown protein, partial [Striga hermonthica]
QGRPNLGHKSVLGCYNARELKVGCSRATRAEVCEDTRASQAETRAARAVRPARFSFTHAGNKKRKIADCGFRTHDLAQGIYAQDH